MRALLALIPPVLPALLAQRYIARGLGEGVVARACGWLDLW